VTRTSPARSLFPTSFRGRLLLVVGIAAIVRVAYALALAPPLSFFDDDAFFHGTAQLLADGHGYLRPLDFAFHGQSIPTAEHPPLYPLLLSVPRALSLDGLDAERMIGVAIGTGTVAVAALIGRRVAGDRAGLAAAVLCATYPSFIAADGAIMSETLFGFLVALGVLAALRLRTRPSPAAAAGLGVAIGLAALTRSEGLLLLPLLGAPALWRASGHRLALGAAVALATVVVVAPWVVRNWEVFGRPVLSDNQGTLLAGSNCRRTYYGKDIGWFSVACVPAASASAAGASTNEAEHSASLTSRGLDYAGAHPGRAVLVAGVRLARVWGLYQPGRQAIATGRRAWVQKVGVVVYYLVVLMAILGAVSLRRRRDELAILLAPVLLASFVALVSWGSVRFRHEAEVMLLVLAGVAIARTRHASPPTD
jgi:4-amino-4-deoxy-L-arabinose transferase-like glycosyltransferase